MTRIAILDDRLPSQARENPAVLEGIELVWSGTDPAELLRRLPALRPHVIVCNITLLGGGTDTTLRELEGAEGLELLLLLYQFARRRDLDALEGDKRRIVQAPVTLDRLRSQMMSVVVRQLLGGGTSDEAPAPRATRTRQVQPAAPDGPADVPPRRYNAQQLGRLAEISTSIDCECPHHLSQLVGSLVAFEDYSAHCESQNEADAAIHRMLWVETAKARAAMEEALAALVRHENITI